MLLLEHVNRVTGPDNKHLSTCHDQETLRVLTVAVSFHLLVHIPRYDNSFVLDRCAGLNDSSSAFLAQPPAAFVNTHARRLSNNKQAQSRKEQIGDTAHTPSATASLQSWRPTHKPPESLQTTAELLHVHLDILFSSRHHGSTKPLSPL